MGAIFKREFKSYFTNLIGAIYAAVFLVVIGLYTSVYVFDYAYPNFEYVIGSILFIMIILVPILTMRTVAEDRKLKTDQLLMSLPLTSSKIVLGKYFALLAFYLLPCAIIAIYPVIISMYGDIFWATTYATLMAFVLLSAALLAIGMFISSLTENQIVAAIISVLVVLFAYLGDSVADMISGDALVSYIGFSIIAVLFAVLIYVMMKNFLIPAIFTFVAVAALTVLFVLNPTLLAGTLPSVLKWFSLFGRMDYFIYGIFDIPSVVYYLSVTGLFVFLTVQAVDKKRWS
ncbi:MAG: ABC-2 transporter permease [Clostridia bacterium]|nr:ABC-2 transporter permease [Clostridia bacterium]